MLLSHTSGRTKAKSSINRVQSLMRQTPTSIATAGTDTQARIVADAPGRPTGRSRHSGGSGCQGPLTPSYVFNIDKAGKQCPICKWAEIFRVVGQGLRMVSEDSNHETICCRYRADRSFHSGPDI